MVLEELINALEEYIALLCEELDETATIAHAHGWRTSRLEEGELLRDKIVKLRNT